VSEHVYDARGYRIRKDTYTSGTLTETRHYYYTPGWQCVEERIGASTNAERQFVWGLRYIDDLILRDRSTANNGTMNERRYAMQDGNWNTIAICDTTGSVTERYAYSAYGTPVFMTGAGVVQTSSTVGFETLYAGYRYDGTTPQMYYVRNRFMLSMVGTWNRRDPLGYVDGMGLMGYSDSPQNFTDPEGREEQATNESLVCIWDHADKGDDDGTPSNERTVWQKIWNAGRYPYYDPYIDDMSRRGRSRISDGRDMHRTAHRLRCEFGFKCFSFRRDYCKEFDAESKGSCIKHLVLHDHGYPNGVMTCGGGSLSPSDVSKLCTRLCKNSSVYLISCSSGKLNGKNENTAEFLLRLCPKILVVYGCAGINFGLRCDGKIREFFRSNSGKSQYRDANWPNSTDDWTKILPRPAEDYWTPEVDEAWCNG
jgi:RHS repeat-associated protein